MIKTTIISTFALLAPCIIQAQGITYLSNIDQGSTGSVALGSDFWRAAILEVGNNASGYILNSVQLTMADASGKPSDFTVMLYASDGNPSGAFPGNSIGTLNGSLSPVTGGIYTFFPASSITLLPRTEYYLVLTAGTPVANGAYDWSLAGTYSYNPSGGWGVANDHGIIGTYLSSRNGLSWGANQGNLQFAITATPVPEPSPEIVLGLGGILVLGFGRCKAKAV